MGSKRNAFTVDFRVSLSDEREIRDHAGGVSKPDTMDFLSEHLDEIGFGAD
jgi:hypothetical protein